MGLEAGYGFVLLGDPVKQGDLKCVGKNGHHQLVHSNAAELKPWRDRVAYGGKAMRRDKAAEHQPIDLVVTFTLARPAKHWGTGRNAAVLKTSAPQYPTSYPDLDKLARAVGDALTKIAYPDDAQIVDLIARKRYADDRALTLNPPRDTAGITLTPDDGLPCPGVVIRIYPKETDDA